MAQINLSQSQQLQLQQAKQIKRLEAPQEATGAVVSTSNRQDTEEHTGRENVSQDEWRRPGKGPKTVAMG